MRIFFGNGHQPFKRTSDSDEADYWPNDGVFAYYDSGQMLEALEFSSLCEASLQGISLTTVMMGEAIDWLRALDPELRLEPDGATSIKLGVGVWSSTGEPDEPVMSVITFGPGYYGQA